MQPQQSNSAVVISAGNELIVAVVVLRLGEKVMVVLVAPNWHVASSHVPKLD